MGYLKSGGTRRRKIPFSWRCRHEHEGRGEKPDETAGQRAIAAVAEIPNLLFSKGLAQRAPPMTWTLKMRFEKERRGRSNKKRSNATFNPGLLEFGGSSNHRKRPLKIRTKIYLECVELKMKGV